MFRARIAQGGLSPPSRAAWIEIFKIIWFSLCFESPPSRAAWIEIANFCVKLYFAIVAAFTGGVD